MSISDICIRRPVFAIVLSLLLATAGCVAFFKLPLRQFPEFGGASISVVTDLPGASAAQVEAQISSQMEAAVAAVAGIKTINSTSVVGESIIQITFRDDVDPRDAANAVAAKAQAALPGLPSGTEAPVVTLAGAGDAPILYIGISDPHRTPLELTDLARSLIRPELSKIDGVAAVDLVGERKYAMIIELDPARLAAEGLMVADVANAINAHNSSTPSGQIDIGQKTTTIVTHAALADVAAFEEVGIVRREGYTVRLRDVGRARIGPETETSAIFVDGRPGLALSITGGSLSNPLDIARDVRSLLPRLQLTLPEGARVEIIFDGAIFIEKSIAEVFETLSIAVLLVIVTALMFLGNLRSALIVMVTIPISLVGALAFLMLLGFSLNIFTLLAIVLAVGLVVDDAIVDVENVERHIAEGRPSIDAAFIGSREVSMAVIATTLTLASIYMPIGFMGGKVGHLFREFGFTLAIAVLVSGFVSRTLSPMMCSRLLRSAEHSRFQCLVQRRLDRAALIYRGWLTTLLAHRTAALGACLLLGVAVTLTATSVHFELAPEEDEGYVMVQLSAETGTTLADMVERSRQVEASLNDVPERLHTLVMLGEQSANSGLAILMLKPWDQRTRSAAEIRRALNVQLGKITRLDAVAFPQPPLGGGSGFPIELVIKTNGSYEGLYEFAERVKAEAMQHAIVSAVSLDLDFGAPKLDVAIDREAAQRIGIDPASISNTLASMFTGARANDFSWDDALYPVILRMNRSEIHGIESFDLIHMRAASGDMIPLSSLVRVERHVGALSLGRQDQQRAVKLTAMPGAGRQVAEATAALEALIRTRIPAGMSVASGSAQKDAADAQASSELVFGLALLIVLLFLSAQFESFRDPAIILVAAPFAVIGGFAGLLLTEGTLNVYSAIALVTLVGMIAKHGILITEFANQRRDKGDGFREGLLDAAKVRFRPIMMTTTAAIAGAFPLLIASGPGANSRIQIGVVMICGMAFGTLISMFLVPIAYSLISEKERRPMVEPGVARV